MSGEASAQKPGSPSKVGGFSSIRNMWKSKEKEVAAGAAARSSRPSKGIGSTAPPQSPSSRANALLSQPHEAVTDGFQQYGIVFADSAGVLSIRKVIPGSAADQTGVIFPGDSLHEVNEIEVYRWQLDRVKPLISGDRAGATLRLAFQRTGFSDLIRVELELTKNHSRPSPRLCPSAPEISTPIEAAAETASPDIGTLPMPVLQAQSQDQPSAGNQSPSHQPPLVELENAKDGLQALVVKRYKTKIQELSQNLEAAQVSCAKQERQVEEMSRFLNEKDELLRELREAVGKLTHKLEESSRENLELRRSAAQFAQSTSDPSFKSAGGDDSHLAREVDRLTTELEAMRKERDLAQFSDRSGVEDSSDLLRELKLQMIEKDAKVQDLEGKIASLKRSNVIQAVELQELHDHVAGMEKQKMALQVQQFPPLPPLQSVRESPYDASMDDDEKMKAILLADEVLHKAQEEIAMLKQRDERRVQLEAWAEQSQQEIQRLQIELDDKNVAGENADARNLRKERDELVEWSQQAKSEIEALQVELSHAQGQVDAAARQLAEIDDLRAKTKELEMHKLNLESQVSSLMNGSQRPVAGLCRAGEETSAEDAETSTEALEDHPLMQTIGMLDQKQAEMHQHVATLSAHVQVMETENTEKLKATIEQLTLNEKLMTKQLEVANEAYAKSREQYLAAEVEINMLRSHLDNLGVHTDLAEDGAIQNISKDPRMAADSISPLLIESMQAEKRQLEEAMTKLQGEKVFIERCLADARLDLSRLESEQENASNALHESQLMVAKMEGKLDASHTCVASLEDQMAKKKEEIASLSEELKRERQNMILADSEKSMEINALQKEVNMLKVEHDELKEQAQQMSTQMEQMSQQLSERQNQLDLIDKEKLGMSETFAAKEAKFAKFADQLKAQKDRASEAEVIAKDAEEEMQRIREELNVEKQRSVLAEERILELQSHLTAKQGELTEALSQKEEAMTAISAQGLELERKIEQTEALQAVIRRLQEGAAVVEGAGQQIQGGSKRTGAADVRGGRPPGAMTSTSPSSATPHQSMQPGPVDGGGSQKSAVPAHLPGTPVPLMPQQTNWQHLQAGMPTAAPTQRPGGGSPWITKTSIM